MFGQQQVQDLTTESEERETENQEQAGVVEVTFPTYQVPKFTLRDVLDMLREIDVCGLVLNGQNVGKEGRVSWIILSTAETLIPIDVALCGRQKCFWPLMRKRIFSNRHLVKVMYNSGPAAAYLHRAHKIQLVNVFDVQVTDEQLMKRSTGSVSLANRSLADCLTAYTTGIPHYELEALRAWEAVGTCVENIDWMTQTPGASLRKVGALQVKHLLTLYGSMVVLLLAEYTGAVERKLASAFVSSSEFLH